MTIPKTPSGSPEARGPRRLPPCGNVECGASTGIDESPTFGAGVLDEHGFWEEPCLTCARSHETANPGARAWPFTGMKVEKKPRIVVDSASWDEHDAGLALAKLHYDGGWEDAGIGPYEFWGAKATDSRPTFVVEPPNPYVRVRFPAVEHTPDQDPADLVPESLSVRLQLGGCDGEHSGRCREGCQEAVAYVRWEIRKITTVEGHVVAAYEFISSTQE